MFQSRRIITKPCRFLPLCDDLQKKLLNSSMRYTESVLLSLKWLIEEAMSVVGVFNNGEQQFYIGVLTDLQRFVINSISPIN
jgi:hypothetical protein